jgi:SAM-dependent methyltransferase
MTTEQDPWDADYQHRGRLWGGSPSPVPLLPQLSRILELGCGNGKTTTSLVQAGYRVTAIDISPHAASLCWNTCMDPDLIGILIGDSRKTPFRDESFDVVIASHITGHLSFSGRRQLAVEVQRLLIQGGTIYFRDFSAGDFRYGHGEETEPGTFTRKNGISTHYFTDDDVLTLFSGLVLRSLEQHRWEMRVKGRDFPRAEIVAEFKKPA